MQDDLFPNASPASPSRPCRVLMVCTGNICRSPTAHGVLRKMADEAGLGARVQVDSAGTHGYTRVSRRMRARNAMPSGAAMTSASSAPAS